MADIFIDGFDKYGPPGTLAAASSGAIVSFETSLTQGEWTSVTKTGNGGSIRCVTGLSAGSGLQFVEGGSNTNGTVELHRTIPITTTIIGGIRFEMLDLAQTVPFGMKTIKGVTAQFSITVNTTSGLISIRTGDVSGTILGTSGVAVTVGVSHYLEWSVTIGASATYHVYLDGTSVISGTGNTRGDGANNNCDSFCFMEQGSLNNTAHFIIDDLYVFDTTGVTNNAVLNTNPIVNTRYAISDSSVAFVFGAGVLDKAYYTTNGTNAPGANELFLIPIVAPYNCTLNSVSCLPQATSAGANFKAVLYSDNAGAPGSLVATGALATGATTAVTLTSAFAAGQSLVLGTQYWIGFITDISVGLQEADTTVTGQKKANTFASGPPPGPLAGMTTGQPTWLIFGGITGVATNFTEDNLNPPIGSLSYVQSSTVGALDLYNFATLPVTPGVIYTVCAKANVALATAGARTVSLLVKSGATTSQGSNPAQTPSTSQSWLDSFYDTDPNTGLAWTASGLNAATAGAGIAS